MATTAHLFLDIFPENLFEDGRSPGSLFLPARDDRHQLLKRGKTTIGRFLQFHLQDAESQPQG